MVSKQVYHLYSTAKAYAPDALRLAGSALCFASSGMAGGPVQVPETAYNIAAGGLILTDVLRESPLPPKLPHGGFKGVLLKAMGTGVKWQAGFALAATYVSARYAINNWEDAAKVSGTFALGMGLSALGTLWKRRRAKNLEILLAKPY